MSTDIRKAAFDLYTPPFRHEHGYILDANNQVVADNGAIGEMKGVIAARIRGWGRIQYMDNPEGRAAALQDEVGAIVADALTAWWQAARASSAAAQPGWVLVPEESTPEMEEAGFMHVYAPTTTSDCERVWRAMVKAAPPAPSAKPDEVNNGL